MQILVALKPEVPESSYPLVGFLIPVPASFAYNNAPTLNKYVGLHSVRITVQPGTTVRIESGGNGACDGGTFDMHLFGYLISVNSPSLTP